MILYRFSYCGKGIYEAFRTNSTIDEWKEFLKSGISSWLPKPPKGTYCTGTEKTYFTELGKELFETKVLPIMEKRLLREEIEVETTDSQEHLVYCDDFQCVLRN